ncbi:MAG TPA: tail fiber protein, partial [Chitinophagaceae bacterium]|nr:tail fiber protein [Chitinophagaceae bacterium]
GIGTETPDAKLTVKGTIHTQEVKVDLNGSLAPDYVFEEGYYLLSLDDVDAYIKVNKHLPEVPSAEEMEGNGINLKEMNLLLLKKLEELTLYVIAQNKRLAEQDNRITNLETELKK